MKRFLWLGWTAFLFLFCAGCGDTFRPIIIPNPPTFPDPRAAHTVMAVNNNGPTNPNEPFGPGSLLVVDVSGDSEVGIANVGVTPVHAVQQSTNQVLVLNQATTNTSTASLSKVFFFGTVINGTPGTISLPPNSAPTFVAVAPSDTTAYVTLPKYVPDPTAPETIVPSVGVVNTQSSALVATIPVGNSPFALAVTPDKSKLYVACDPLSPSSCSVSAFNTLDRSQRTISGTLSSFPIWLSARSDSQRVYVLEAGGKLAWLDTTSTPGPDTLTESTISVPGATTMVYDGLLNRLYIPGGSEVAVVDVSQSSPQIIGNNGNPIPITTFPEANRGTQDVCHGSHTGTPPAATVVAVTALPDGSRAYVGAYYEDAVGNICPQVTVINTSNNSVKTVTAVPGFPNYDALCASTRFRFTMAAGGDSSRAYLASCDGGGVNVIDTSTDSFLVNLPAPFGARPPISPSPQNPPQNPVFLIAGP
jgi:DNA-binding beta-propeller fold protein YncE